MGVGAAAHQTEPVFHQSGRQGSRVGHHLPRVVGEFRRQRLPERDRLGGDHVHHGPSLGARKHRPVDGARVFRRRQDETPAGPAQGLVRGRGHHVRVGNGAGMHAGGDEAGDVGHVDHQERVHFARDFAERGEIEGARIGAGPRDDQTRALRARLRAHDVVVDEPIRLAHAVGRHPEPLAADVDRGSVREMAPVAELHSQKTVSGLEEGEKGGQVGLRSGMRLNVGVVRLEECAGALAGQALRHVDVLAAAVVATSREPFRVLVGEGGARCLQDRPGSEVLAGDHLQLIALPGLFGLDGLMYLRVETTQVVGRHWLARVRCSWKPLSGRGSRARRFRGGGHPSVSEGRRGLRLRRP